MRTTSCYVFCWPARSLLVGTVSGSLANGPGQRLSHKALLRVVIAGPTVVREARGHWHLTLSAGPSRSSLRSSSPVSISQTVTQCLAPLKRRRRTLLRSASLGFQTKLSSSPELCQLPPSARRQLSGNPENEITNEVNGCQCSQTELHPVFCQDQEGLTGSARGQLHRHYWCLIP